MSVFALPALIALITKMWVYVLAKNTKYTPRTFLWLIGFFAVHNLSEFAVISTFSDGNISVYLLKFYYVAALFSLAYMCIYATSVGSEEKHNTFNVMAISLAAVLSFLVLSTDLIIGGAVSVGYTVSAIKGSYYYIFQMAALLGFALIFSTLLRRYLSSTDNATQLKCFYAALSLSPVIVISIIVIGMMQAGYQYTGAILLPFSSTFFLLLVVLTEKNSDLIRIRYKLPFSNRRASEKQFLAVFRSHMNDELGLSETKAELEKLLIQSALDSSHGNVTRAAEKLGIKRSTFYSILNRLDMKKGAGDLSL